MVKLSRKRKLCTVTHGSTAALLRLDGKAKKEQTKRGFVCIYTMIMGFVLGLGLFGILLGGVSYFCFVVFVFFFFFFFWAEAVSVNVKC